MRQRQLGASTASSRVWHRRHPATVEFGSIHKTATFVRSYISKEQRGYRQHGRWDHLAD